jgi:thioredoxin:protein disulfide reductase
MARAIYFLLALLVFVLIAVAALLSQKCAAPVTPEGFSRRRTLDEARARAEDSGRPVLVFVTAEWCEECRALKAGALNSSRVTTWIVENTEPVYLDVTRSASGDTDAQAMLMKLNVETPPAILLLRKGAELGRVEGAPSSKELLKQLQAMVK